MKKKKKILYAIEMDSIKTNSGLSAQRNSRLTADSKWNRIIIRY